MMQKLLRRRKGFTLMELCIALVLIIPVAFLAVNIVTATTKATLDTETELMVVRQDTGFVAKLNDIIRKSTTGFTIPKQSFIEDNLTAGWHYIGLMDNVKIPKSVSRTGAQTTAQALVYLEYAGNTAPSRTPEGANIIHTKKDGYYIQHVLAHSYTDSNGLSHEYSLTFKPKETDQSVVKEISYELKSVTKDANGNQIGQAVDISTLLAGINAIQFVYRGSDVNPAVAMAFHPGFMPTQQVLQEKDAIGTISLVLDMSTSMNDRIAGPGSKTRIEVLKESLKKFLLKVEKDLPTTFVILNTFSDYGNDWKNYKNNYGTNSVFYRAGTDMKDLLNVIDKLKPDGQTNIGDGLRVAEQNLNTFLTTTDGGVWIKKHLKDPKHVVILLTDGQSNVYSSSAQTEPGKAQRPKGITEQNPQILRQTNVKPNYLISVGTTGTFYAKPNTGYERLFDDRTDPFFENAGPKLEAVYDKTTRKYIRERGSSLLKSTQQNGKNTIVGYLIDFQSTKNGQKDGMSQGDKNALVEALGIPKDAQQSKYIFSADSEIALNNAFDSIKQNAEEVLWAFTGPRI